VNEHIQRNVSALIFFLTSAASAGVSGGVAGAKASAFGPL